MSIDTLEENDLEGSSADIPFIMDRDLADQYGTRFVITLDAQRIPVVTPRR